MDLRANTAVDLLIGPFVDKTDGNTTEDGLTLTQAEIKLSKNGQALTQKSDVTSAAFDDDGYYNCELDTTDLNTEGNLVLIVHQSANALSVRHEYNVLSEAAWDSLYAAKDAGFMDVNIKTVGRADTQETEANNLESACSNYSATRGLTGTAVPAVAADGVGGLPISDAGGLDLDAILADTNELQGDWADGGRLDLIQDIIAADVLNIDGAAMRGTDSANTVVPDVAGTAAGLHTTSDALIGTPTDADIATDIVNVQNSIDSIANVGAAIHEPVVASPGGFVLTTGVNEVNNEDSTQALDGILHTWDSTGNAMEGRYLFNIGGAYDPLNVTLVGKLEGAVGDIVNVNVNTGTTASPVWETRGSITRTNVAASNVTHSYILFPGDTTTGVDAGNVQIQVVNNGAVTGATFIIDQAYCSKSLNASTTGYSNGAIWVDTVNGVAGTVEDVNGTADNPCLTWADALTLNGNLPLNRFAIKNGSTITLSGNSDNYTLFGAAWTLVLNDQSASGMAVKGADVSGVATGANELQFLSCHIGSATLPPFHMENCGLVGTLTLGTAGDFFFDDCHSMVAGESTPILDFNSGLNASQINMRDYSGGIEIQNMGAGTGAYNMSIEGDGQFIINANCSATSTVAVRGSFKITDNASGAVTIDDVANYEHNAIIDAILADTGELQTNQGNWLTATGFSTHSAVNVRTEMDSNSTQLIAIVADTNELQVDLTNGGRLDLIFDAILADTGELQTNQGNWLTATGFSTHTAANVRTEVDLNSTQLIAIVADTGELQTNQGNWLTATGFSTHSAANVRTEMDSNSTRLSAAAAADTDVQSRLPAALVGGKMNADATAISGSTDAADKLEASAEVILTGAAVAGTLSTTQMSTDLTVTVAGQFNGAYLVFKEDTTTVALRGQRTEVSETAVSGSVLTFTAITTAPVVGDTFVLV